MLGWLRIAIIALALALPGTLRAQDPEPGPALLAANQVFVQGENRLVASGAVQAFYDGITLSAERITYDQSADSLLIEGPVRIIDETGRVTIVADGADLDAQLQNGLLRGARIVMDDQLQLAASAAQRIDGRYTVLDRVAVTSCQVCTDGGPPLWQIRADRVIHDQEERQIYFDQAQLRVLDMPIAYIPRLRLPDPTLQRARGFLFPTFRSSSLLGVGVKVPYFFPIGRHQDLTLTPYLSPHTRTLEYRYRRAFRTGRLQLEGSVSGDTLEDSTRAYLFATGDFRLPRDLRLTFDLKTVSDAAYLNDYGVSGTDRLESTLSLSRVRTNAFFDASLAYYESLRDSDDNETQPSRISDIRTERRWFLAGLPGEFRLGAELHAHDRPSSSGTDGPDADSEVDGRDVTRLNAEASWRNRWTLPMGVRMGASAFLWMDRIDTRQDPNVPDSVSQAIPGAALELRWPLARSGPAGGRTLIEPVMQLGWVGGERLGNANDESTRVEFDEANLLSLSRFPAADRREHGATLAAGIRWVHDAPSGWRGALTLGQIWREDQDPDFSRSSGLEGVDSDLLVAGRFSNDNGISLLARGLLDETARFSKAEARADWTKGPLDLGASYVLLVTDPDEDRTQAQSEWSLDVEYQINRNWRTSTDWRYDLADRRLDRVGLGLRYHNECVEVALSAKRQLASSTTLDPSTDFDLTVTVLGFSTGGSAKENRHSCSP